MNEEPEAPCLMECLAIEDPIERNYVLQGLGTLGASYLCSRDGCDVFACPSKYLERNGKCQKKHPSKNPGTELVPRY